MQRSERRHTLSLTKRVRLENRRAWAGAPVGSAHCSAPWALGSCAAAAPSAQVEARSVREANRAARGPVPSRARGWARSRAYARTRTEAAVSHRAPIARALAAISAWASPGP
eukprot:7376749-Prymnesium_polylepis.1